MLNILKMVLVHVMDKATVFHVVKHHDMF